MSSKKLTTGKIHTALLANPITGWGRENYLAIISDELKKLNQKQQIIKFLNDARGGYAKPCFLDKEYLNKIDTLENDEDENISCYFKTYKTREEYSRMETEYNNFCEYFLRENSWVERRLFTITGTAGSGKTTLAHKLISQKTNKLIVKGHDFETVPENHIMFII
ncbi:MAG: hypothetical protein FWD36_03075 [Treponema sp.]|nr:hypothetical protein [Treponema sp.]